MDAKELGKRIQQERKKRGWTQEKISRGRLIELCKLLKLPPQDMVELANT